MPYYPKKQALKRGIDLQYGKKQITASITSSILQGRSIKGIADDLQGRITTMSRASAIRTARTAVTGAQNAGRMDSYKAAEGMGIKLKKQWLSTLDNRTRHAHAMLDGQTVDTDKPFKVDGYELMYPGDRSAPGYLVYNCRCTTIAVLPDVDTSDALRRDENGLLPDMTFAQWEASKRGYGVDPISKYNIQQKTVAKSVQSGTIKAQAEPPRVYQQFETGDAVNDFFYYDGENRGLMARKNSEHGKWMRSLSDDERDSIGDYTGGGYYDLNNYLRKTGDWQNIDPQKEEYLASNIDSAISRYRLKDNIRVQRGVMEDALDELIAQYGDDSAQLIGKVYHDNGYMSTTALHGNPVATAKPVIFEIDIPAGTGRGAYVNQLAGQYQDAEYEFLLARGSKFTITEIVENDEPIPPQTIIKMRMIVDE